MWFYSAKWLCKNGASALPHWYMQIQGHPKKNFDSVFSPVDRVLISKLLGLQFEALRNMGYPSECSAGQKQCRYVEIEFLQSHMIFNGYEGQLPQISSQGTAW